MKKQPFSTGLVLAVMMCTFLVGTSVKVNASLSGTTVIIGASEESSTSSGDTFSPNVSPTSTQTEDNFGGNVGVSSSREVQKSLDDATANIKTLKEIGVPEESVESLATALTSLSGNQLTSVNISGNARASAANSPTAQQSASPTLNVNKLNAAITAYNKIVKQSSPEVIKRLAVDPKFRQINKLLKQLRADLTRK